MVNWNIHTRIFHWRVSLFQFPIKPQICLFWLEKCYPKDKLNKSTRIICLIYFSMAQFNDNMKFLWRNLNINDLMLINLHISLITKRFFRSVNRHNDKTVTYSELLLDTTISVIKLWMLSESLTSLASKLYELLG